MIKNHSTTRAGWLIALSAVVAPPAWAWGADGHQLIAELAQTRLDSRAAAEAARLLALEPGETLRSISTWADEVRSPTTSAWHYVNFEPGHCTYNAQQQCSGGQCVVGAIERQSRVLHSAASDAERLKALKYVVHLVGDVHQPLHAGYADDRGGNLFQMRWLGRGTNLHAVWDSGLIKARSGGLPVLWSDLKTRSSAPPKPSTQVEWAQASCRIAQAEGFYPDSRKPGPAYAEQFDAVLVGQLDAAAWHLAQLLNDALGARP